MTNSSSKLQNKHSEVLCLQNKKAFRKYRVLYKILYPQHCSLEESIVVIMWKSINVSTAKSNLEIYSQNTL